MRQLDARCCAFGVQEVDDMLERRNLPVLPQAEVAIGDAPLRVYPGRLEDDQAEAAKREPPEVHEVPVVGVAVLGRILAHRRHHGAVAQSEVTQGEGRK